MLKTFPQEKRPDFRKSWSKFHVNDRRFDPDLIRGTSMSRRQKRS
jgi:hypothetical protein